MNFWAKLVFKVHALSMSSEYGTFHYNQLFNSIYYALLRKKSFPKTLHVHIITFFTDWEKNELTLTLIAQRFFRKDSSKSLKEFFNQNFFPFASCLQMWCALYSNLFFRKCRKNVSLRTHNHNCFFKIIKIGKAREKKGFMIYRNFIDFLLMFFCAVAVRAAFQLHGINYFLIVYIRNTSWNSQYLLIQSHLTIFQFESGKIFRSRFRLIL